MAAVAPSDSRDFRKSLPFLGARHLIFHTIVKSVPYFKTAPVFWSHSLTFLSYFPFSNFLSHDINPGPSCECHTGYTGSYLLCMKLQTLNTRLNQRSLSSKRWIKHTNEGSVSCIWFIVTCYSLMSRNGNGFNSKIKNQTTIWQLRLWPV